MADLIDRQAAKELALAAETAFNARIRTPIKAKIARAIATLLDSLPAVDAVEVGSCEGCIYSNRERPQKCSCCRRNRYLKDCYCGISGTIRRKDNA